MTLSRRFFLAVLLLITLVAGGTAGYAHFEGWTLQRSLYMTVITMSTVGFREVADLSPAGEWFTMVFICLSITVAGFAVASITAFVVQGELTKVMKGRRMQKQIESLDKHYIICGCGAVGREIVTELTRAKVPFVVVEKIPEEAEMPRHLEVPMIQGDATDEDILMQAGIQRARGLIAALRGDPENVFVTLTARQLNPNLQIIARASEKGTESKLRRAGADRVISPFEIAGQRMASLVLRPNVVNFLDVITHRSDGDLRLEEIRLAPNSKLAGKTLREADLGRRTRAVIVGISDSQGKPRSDPAAGAPLSEIPLRADDILIVLGSEEQLRQLAGITGA